MVFLPVYDYNKLRYIKYPYVTWALIVVNVFIYVVFQSGWLFNWAEMANSLFGFMPASILPNSGAPLDVPAILANTPGIKLFTYQFLHADFGHLFFNMLFLWVFGDNIEDAMGRTRYFVFYIACGVAGGLAHFWSQTTSQVPLVGASGAISGLLAAYLILFPRVKIWTLLFTRIPIKLRAIWVLGAYLLFNVAQAAMTSMDNVAWWAHLGGFGAGAILVFLMRRPGVVLFAKDADTLPEVAAAAAGTPPPVVPVPPGTNAAPVAPIDAGTVVVRVDRPKSEP
jgi:membrane associated rhomboid family serine protease